MPAARRATPVQLKNQGNSAKAAREWQRMKPMRVSVFSFTLCAV